MYRMRRYSANLSKDDRERVFRQPFSQVIGASPIVRLRVGDVIKSNYSKFNLQRIFGAGESESQFIDAGNDEDNVLERFNKRFIEVQTKIKS